MEKRSFGSIVTILFILVGINICCGSANDYEDFDSPTEISELSIPKVKMAAFLGRIAIISEGKVKVVCLPCKEGEIIPEPRDLPGINNSVDINAAVDINGEYNHFCVLLADSTIKCYGNNNYGQLGDGTFDFSPTLVDVLGIHNAIQIDTGHRSSCALLADGTIKCWGLVFCKSDNCITNPVPVDVGIQDVIKVEVMGGSFYALLKNGTIKAWGSNNNNSGQMGNGSWDDPLTPVTVLGVNNAKDIKASHQSACALLADGTVKCWGKGDMIATCDPDFSNSNVPIRVCELEKVKSLYSSQANYCALLKDGTVKCWGANDLRLLGQDKFLEYNYPVKKNIDDVILLSMGPAQACALKKDGTVFCWGGGKDASPWKISGIENAVDLELSGWIPQNHSNQCALLADGNVQCWNNFYNYIFDINEN